MSPASIRLGQPEIERVDMPAVASLAGSGPSQGVLGVGSEGPPRHV